MHENIVDFHMRTTRGGGGGRGGLHPPTISKWQFSGKHLRKYSGKRPLPLHPPPPRMELVPYTFVYRFAFITKEHVYTALMKLSHLNKTHNLLLIMIYLSHDCLFFVFSMLVCGVCMYECKQTRTILSARPTLDWRDIGPPHDWEVAGLYKPTNI